MRTTIDQAGRVVIPKPLRDRLGLSGGTAVEVDERDGWLELRPAGRGIVVDDSGERPVLRAENGAAVLTTDEVRSLVEETRG